jgi:hypothetical protein
MTLEEISSSTDIAYLSSEHMVSPKLPKVSASAILYA